MDPSSSLHQNDASSSFPLSQKRTFLYSRSSSSSSNDNDNDDVSSSNSIHSTNRRLDCMLQFLDRKLTVSDHLPLPEFIAKGGGAGIFKPPLRAAVHPSRPPSLELRPHPLRETQIGRFLRNIVATESQLWSATERGLRLWNFKDLYASWYGGERGVVRSGDEESAPFRESVWTSPAICVVADEGNRLVWSGHRDGKIRCWRMYAQSSDFNERLSWQAHRGPVLSITITSYGYFSFSILSYYIDFASLEFNCHALSV